MSTFLYYSEDVGLLDHLAHEFKSKHESVKHLKNVTSSDVELSLIQGSLDSFCENVIIDNYQGSLDVLSTIINHSGSSNVLILTDRLPYGRIMEIIDNDDWKLKPLNETTKKGYLNKLMLNRYPGVKIPKEILDIIKSSVPPSACSINELMDNVVSLYNSQMLNDGSVRVLMEGLSREFNFFQFLFLYLEDDQKWIKFFNEGVISDDSFRQFSYSLSHQLLELKKFIHAWGKRPWKDISSFAKLPKHTVSICGKLLKKYGLNFGPWIDNFIIDLYNLHTRLIFTFEVNLSLMKYFLLSKKASLERS